MYLPRLIALLVCCAVAGSAHAADPEPLAGLFGSYYDTMDLTGPRVTRVDPQLSFTWTSGTSPIAGIAANTWSARWTGHIVAPATGSITIATRSDDGIEVWIDRKLVIRNWTNHGPTRNAATVAMAAGQSYEIIVSYYNNTGGGVAELLWTYGGNPETAVPSSHLRAADITQQDLPPAGGSGFEVAYYNNDYFAGAPIPGGYAAKIAYNWGTKAPIAGITGYRWSGIWRGTLEAPVTDTYTLMTSHTGSLLVYLDGKLVINKAKRGSNVTATYTVPLVAGSRHPIEVRFANPDTSAKLSLFWSATTILPGLLPGSQVFAPVADTTPFAIDSIDARISPVWIAGQASRSAAIIEASVDDLPLPTIRGGTTWFLDDIGSADGPPGLRLQPKQTRTVAITVDGQTQTRHVQWETIDLANTYGIDPLTIRRGDSLLLTHAGEGELLEIDTDFRESLGFRPAQTGVAGEGIAVPFPASGTFLVRARVGGQLAGSMTVRVVGVDLKGPIACEILYPRNKDVAVSHPSLVSFGADDPQALLCSVTGPVTGGSRLSLCPTDGSRPTLLARLGADGPVIARHHIDTFMIESTVKRKTPIEIVYPDGSYLCFASLIMTPGVPNLDVKMHCFKAGVTFVTGSVNMTVNTSDFVPVTGSTVGATKFTYELIMGANVGGGACHNFVVHQNNVQISY